MLSRLILFFRGHVLIKLLLRSTLVLAAAIIAASWAVYQSAHQQILSVFTERQRSLTEVYADRFDHKIEDLQLDLETVRSLPSWRDYSLAKAEGDEAAAQEALSRVALFLRALYLREPAYELVRVVDVRSADLLSVIKGGMTIYEPVIRRGMDMPHGRGMVEDRGLGSLPDGTDKALIYSAPIVEDGVLHGRIMVYFSLSRLMERFSQEQFGDQGYTAIYDGSGQIIYDSQYQAGMLISLFRQEWRYLLTSEQPAAVDSLTTVDGRVDIVSITKMRTKDWLVVVATPRAEMLARLIATRDRLIFWALVALLVESALLAWFARNLILSPIHKLLAGTKAVLAGDYAHRVSLRGGDEFGQLADSFNFMTTSLKCTIDQMEDGQRDKRILNEALQEKVRQLEKQIGRRKRVTMELKESESRLQSVMDNTSAMVFIKDCEGRYLSVNKQFERVMGFSQKQCQGRLDDDLFPTKSATSIRAIDYRVLQEEVPVESEDTLPTIHGERIYLSTRFPLWDALGRIYAICGIATDITQRKRGEEETRRWRRLLESMMHSLPSLVIGVGADFKVTMWNQQAVKTTGLPSEFAEGMDLGEVLHGFDSVMPWLGEAINAGDSSYREKVRFRRGDELRYADLAISPMSDEFGGAVIRIDDVTERVRMKEMLVQSEKMLMVGGLAAGMAHEINNPLAGILQNVQVLRNRLLGDLPKNRRIAEEKGLSMDALSAYLEARDTPQLLTSIISSGNRAAEIVANMLTFSRKSEARVADEDLGGLLDRAVELVSNDYNLKKNYDFRSIEIVRSYDRNVTAPCEAGKIQQVFANILKNGAQAMMTRQDMPDPPRSRFILRIRRLDDAVRIEIEDNGTGMSSDVAKRAFEPFYTTKGVGTGTGLGLSVSYFIITENHGGSIWVESTKGRGSCFVILLPVARKSKEQEQLVYEDVQ